ncbi:MAG: hypothetical protein JSV04_11835 [Candidatus Heimdallarchaeota archaeon]|nr:MAG: hypothetical protein JSV04_11835 [Candidatus Heimdallarchaeota archaeon]
MVKETPIFAESFFQITPHQIFQSLYFYYHDPSKNFFHLEKTGASEGELEAVQENLQYWIDEDDLFVNNEKIRMLIQDTNLHFQENDPFFPFLFFSIESQYYQLYNERVNEIHLYAKPEKIPYPAISCWEVFTGKIISVESNSFNIISHDKTHTTFYLTKGEIIGGDERIFVNISLEKQNSEESTRLKKIEKKETMLVRKR